MIKSMTGYGKAEAATEHKKITVEIRSLNSKQLDLAVKLPSAYRQCEYEIRQRVGKRLQRGKIDVFVSYETVGRATGVTIDRDIFAHYAGQLRELAEASGLGWGSATADAAAMTAILKLPDTVQNNSEAVSDEELTALGSAVAEALDRIDEFRAQEGTTLIADLLRRIDRIEQIKNEIEPYEKARTETIKARIREHVESLGIPYDAGRLEQEMIYYIENWTSPRRKSACRTTAAISAKWRMPSRERAASSGSSRRSSGARSIRSDRSPTKRRCRKWSSR